MLKRELIRVMFIYFFASIIGYMVSHDIQNGLIIGVYGLGYVYAGQMLISMIVKLGSLYLKGQILSIISKSVLGGVICIVFLVFGISVVFAMGWIIGLLRCGYMIYQGGMTDHELFGGDY